MEGCTFRCIFKNFDRFPHLLVTWGKSKSLKIHVPSYYYWPGTCFVTKRIRSYVTDAPYALRAIAVVETFAFAYSALLQMTCWEIAY